jgi:hypothetical protein
MVPQRLMQSLANDLLTAVVKIQHSASAIVCWKRVDRRPIFLATILCAAFTTVFATAQLVNAAEDIRVALVIGNGAYANAPLGAIVRYRLLDTTRAYVLAIHGDDAEFAEVAARHANYYRRWLEQSGAEWPTLSTWAQRAPHFAALDNVRTALEWASAQAVTSIPALRLRRQPRRFFCRCPY